MNPQEALQDAYHCAKELGATSVGELTQGMVAALAEAGYTIVRRGLDWPTLANIIREVDGNHDLGAGELAERILAHPRFAADTARPTRECPINADGQHITYDGICHCGWSVLDAEARPRALAARLKEAE